MKKIITVLAIFALAGAVFGNGVSLNSPGTRALSMAGAVISNVGDYSAPYWNPAGLQNGEGVQLSFFLTDIVPMASYKYTLPASLGGATIDAEGEPKHFFVPNLAFLWNCKLSDRLRMGLSFIVPAGLGTDWDGNDLLAFNGPALLTGGVPNLFNTDSFTWESDLDVWNLSFSTGYTFGEKLNVGGAFHLVNGKMKLERGVDAVSNINPATLPPDDLLDSQYEEESDGWGYGFGLGFQYMATEKITIGGMIRTRMNIGLSGDAKVSNSALGTLADYEFDRDLTLPLQTGGGISFRPTEKLLVAAEVFWTQWSETQDYLIATHDSQKDTLTLLWEDALQIRFGGEYKATDALDLRAGFYIDPAPSPDKTQTILIPNVDFLGFTAGAGYTINKFTLEATFEYLLGSDREIDEADVMPGVGMPGTHSYNIIAPSVAVTYKF